MLAYCHYFTCSRSLSITAGACQLIFLALSYDTQLSYVWGPLPWCLSHNALHCHGWDRICHVCPCHEDTDDIIHNVIHGTDAMSMRCEIAIQFGNKFPEWIQKWYVPFISSSPLSFRCFALAELRILSEHKCLWLKSYIFLSQTLNECTILELEWIMRWSLRSIGSIF